MLFSALQTKGAIAINCWVKGETLWVDTLILNNPEILNTKQTLFPSFKDERHKGSVSVLLPDRCGLYKDETLVIIEEHKPDANELI